MGVCFESSLLSFFVSDEHLLLLRSLMIASVAGGLWSFLVFGSSSSKSFIMCCYEFVELSPCLWLGCFDLFLCRGFDVLREMQSTKGSSSRSSNSSFGLFAGLGLGSNLVLGPDCFGLVVFTSLVNRSIRSHHRSRDRSLWLSGSRLESKREVSVQWSASVLLRR